MKDTSWSSILLWGFAATLILTTLLRGSQGLGLTRMDISFMLGTMLTPDRDRAKVVGAGVHVVNGWIFAFVHTRFFHGLGGAT